MTIGPDLKQRTLSALIMIPVVLGLAFYGGLPFALFWFAASGAILYEWARVARLPMPIAYAGLGIVAIGASLVLLHLDRAEFVLPVLLFAVLAGGLMTRNLRAGSGGIVVAAAACLPMVVLRGDTVLGFWAVLYIFAVVWSTDIGAYFVGRTLGGPKLAPRLSPNKTWSGAIGGAVFGTLAGLLLLMVSGLRFEPMTLLVGFALSTVGQMGDLAESAFKRAFGVKDAGQIIPGHGGALDRLDGFMAACLLALLIGLGRNLAAPAAGLLLW